MGRTPRPEEASGECESTDYNMKALKDCKQRTASIDKFATDYSIHGKKVKPGTLAG